MGRREAAHLNTGKRKAAAKSAQLVFRRRWVLSGRPTPPQQKSLRSLQIDAWSYVSSFRPFRTFFENACRIIYNSKDDAGQAAIAFTDEVFSAEEAYAGSDHIHRGAPLFCRWRIWTSAARESNRGHPN